LGSLLLTVVLVPLLTPTPVLRISRETTFLTTPVDRYGLPDYRAYLAKQIPVRDNPEQNAIRHLLSLEDGANDLAGNAEAGISIGDLPWIDDEVRQGLATHFQVKESASPSPVFMHPSWFFDEWAEETSTTDAPVDADALYSQYDTALQMGPWRAGEFPAVHELLQRNGFALGVFATAADCQHARLPLSLSPDESLASAYMLLDWYEIHELADLVCTRAMRSLGEDNHAAALNDARLLERLARLWAVDAFRADDISTAASVEKRASDIRAAVLANDPPAEIVAHIERKLAEMSPLLSEAQLIEFVDVRARCVALDEMANCAAGTDRRTYFDIDDLWPGTCGFGGGSVGHIDWAMRAVELGIDWNPVLRQINNTCDQTVAALRETDPKARRERLESLEFDRFDVFLNSYYLETDLRAVLHLYLAGPHGRGRKIAPLVVHRVLPSFHAIATEVVAADVRHDLLRAMILANRARDQLGHFPASLDDFPAELRRAWPDDRFSNGPLKYVPRENGGSMFVYSVGADGADDDGFLGKRSRSHRLVSDDIVYARVQFRRLAEKPSRPER
jgi:hypothetical protein